MNSAVKSCRSLVKILDDLRGKGRKIVFTNGCFDIIHAGHVSYLEKAKALGDVLVVGLNSDRSVRRIKGPGRPLNNESDRAKVLGSLRFVDYITIFDESTPEKVIRALMPDIIVKGGDWKAKDIVGAEAVIARGGRVAVIPFVRGHSTTSLIKRIAEF